MSPIDAADPGRLTLRELRAAAGSTQPVLLPFLHPTVTGQKIGLFPQTLDFGIVTLGHDATRSLRISNLGFSNLEVRDATITGVGYDSYFSSPFVIPPFAFVTLTVVFSPEHEGSHSAEIVIESNDPKRPHASVTLLGTAQR